MKYNSDLRSDMQLGYQFIWYADKMHFLIR